MCASAYACVRVCVRACVVNSQKETRTRAHTYVLARTHARTHACSHTVAAEEDAKKQKEEEADALRQQKLARPTPKKLDLNQLEDTTKNTTGGIENFMQKLEGIERMKQSAEER